MNLSDDNYIQTIKKKNNKPKCRIVFKSFGFVVTNLFVGLLLFLVYWTIHNCPWELIQGFVYPIGLIFSIASVALVGLVFLEINEMIKMFKGDRKERLLLKYYDKIHQKISDE